MTPLATVPAPRSRARRSAPVGVLFHVLRVSSLLWAAPLAAQLEVPTEARTVELGPLSARTAAAVGPPIYRLGWADEHAFGYIISGVLLPDGSAAILDRQARQLVVLDPAGRIRQIIGREGEGPGEFRSPLTVTRKGHDTLVVEDDGNGRLDYFFDGELVRDERYSEVDMGLFYAAKRWEGEFVYWTRSATPSPLPDGWTHNVVLRSSSASSVLDTVATYRMFSTPRPSLSNPFRTNGKVGLTEGAVVAAWGNQAQFVRLSLDGLPPVHVRWEEDSPALTDSIWDEHVAYERSRFGQNADLRIGRRGAVDGPLPIIGELRGDPTGRIWISRWGPADSPANGTAGPYRVFGPDGTWLGWVELPFRMRVLDIGSDRILGVQKDEFDIQAVVVLPLQLGPGNR